MKTVSVSELKAHLSKYLRDVRRGSEIQVLDRGVPVARLVQPGGGAEGASENRERLIAAGVIRGGKGGVERILRSPAMRVAKSISTALDDERGDRV